MKNIIVLCLSLLIINGVHGQSKPQKTIGHINLKIDYKGPVTDTIIVVMQNILYPNLDNLHHRNIKADSVLQQKFFFHIPVEDSSGYLSIAKILPEKVRTQYDLRGILNEYYWEIGDDVQIGISFPFPERPEWAEFTFEGKGSAKYQAKNEVKNLYLKDVPYADLKDSTFRKGDASAIEKVSSIVRKYAPSMSYKSLQIINADIFYRRSHDGAVSVFNGAIRDSVRRKKFIQNFDSVLYNIEIAEQDKKYFKYSMKYPRYYLSALYDRTVVYYGVKRPNLVYKQILKETDRELREKLLVMFFLRNQGDDSTSFQYQEALHLIKTEKYKLALEEIRAKYEPSSLAKYSFIDLNGASRSLSSYKGKVVLIDIWGAGCGGCASLYAYVVSKIEEQFKNNKDFRVISICVDTKTERWKKGIASGSFTSEHGADNLYVGKKGMRHPFIVDFNIPGIPCAILINKQGYIEQFNTTLLYSESTLKNEILKLLHTP